MPNTILHKRHSFLHHRPIKVEPVPLWRQAPRYAISLETIRRVLYSCAGALVLSALGIREARATVNVYVATGAPATLQADLIAAITTYYQATVTPSAYFPGTYTVTLKSKKTVQVPPLPTPAIRELGELVDELDIKVAELSVISSNTYVYGWADGTEEARKIDVKTLQGYELFCSSATHFWSGISTTTWNSDTCRWSLWAARNDIYNLNYSTPTLVPGH